jgi:hypothetical protein
MSQIWCVSGLSRVRQAESADAAEIRYLRNDLNSNAFEMFHVGICKGSGVTEMSIDMRNWQNLQSDVEIYYEIVASQEEVYLEEIEEELRMILSVEDSAQSVSSEQMVRRKVVMLTSNSHSGIAETVDEERSHAAEELITGDSDDAPLSDEAITDML